MKLGFGLYRHMLTDENFKFAKQAGCTHLVIHMVDYYNNVEGLPQTNSKQNMGFAKTRDEAWEYENLLKLKERVNSYGLEWEAIENFSPGDWYHILLDGPKREEQMEYLKQVIRNVGKAGIPVFGYNFSIAGVYGHIRDEVARGGAMTVRFDGSDEENRTPIPNGQIWNMTYDLDPEEGYLEEVTVTQLWERLERFLKEITPVAEEAGVRLAAHPDDPPVEVLRGMARLVNQPDLYQKLIDIYPSHFNALEFCMGTIQEMTEGNIYDAIDQYASQGKIAYVHFRNVIGKVPTYQEAFIDEGDIDMIKALRIFKKHNFDGVFIPDHTPLLECDAPWHAGMAYALGYMKAALRVVNEESGE